MDILVAHVIANTINEISGCDSLARLFELFPRLTSPVVLSLERLCLSIAGQ